MLTGVSARLTRLARSPLVVHIPQRRPLRRWRSPRSAARDQHLLFRMPLAALATCTTVNYSWWGSAGGGWTGLTPSLVVEGSTEVMYMGDNPNTTTLRVFHLPEDSGPLSWVNRVGRQPETLGRHRRRLQRRAANLGLGTGPGPLERQPVEWRRGGRLPQGPQPRAAGRWLDWHRLHARIDRRVPRQHRPVHSWA